MITGRRLLDTFPNVPFVFKNDQMKDGNVPKTPRKKESEEAGKRPIRILILEDERLIAEVLRMIVEQNGYEVVAIAASGEEAIKKAEESNPDLLLMDIRVAGVLDGIETAILIQSSSKKNIPIIFLTAHPPEQFPHIKQLDPSSFIYLRKPYGDEDLLFAIQQILDKQK